jgi:hypothetical protein
MTQLLNDLKVLFPLDTVAKAQAASRLVCREVIKDNPLPTPEQFDLETIEADIADRLRSGDYSVQSKELFKR